MRKSLIDMGLAVSSEVMALLWSAIPLRTPGDEVFRDAGAN